MGSETVRKEIVDNIRVKRFESNNTEMIRLQSEKFGVYGADSLPKALRNLADSLELSNKADEVSELPIQNIEEKKTVVSLRESQSEAEDPENREKISQS